MFTPAKQTGNYATKSVTSSAFFDGSMPFFQAKLTVNQPGDTYEQEADRVADQVMRMKDGDAPVVQRTSLGTGSGIMRKCNACEKEEEKKLHRKESGSGDAGGKAAPAVVGDVLSSGGGRPMDGGTRQFMESRFGQDFSSVRIHNDSRAAESAAAIQARAYTSGRDIVFGAGEYRPGSEEGRRLLAHELVHVGQQGGGLVRSRPFLIQRSPGSPAGGCGVCYGSPAIAGLAAHALIQGGLQAILGKNIILAERLVPSPDDKNGRLDLAISAGADKVLIAEIKPNNRRGIEEGNKDLKHYTNQLKALGMQVELLEWIPRIPVLPFPTLGMGASCPLSQALSISSSPAAPGVILYDCNPDFKELIKKCKCRPSKKRREKKVESKEEKAKEKEKSNREILSEKEKAKTSVDTYHDQVSTFNESVAESYLPREIITGTAPFEGRRDEEAIKKRTIEDSNLPDYAKYALYGIIGLLSIAAILGIIACFISGICEVAIILGGVATAAVAIVLSILKNGGIQDRSNNSA